MNARIYQIKNDLNKKIYVGQTFKTLEDRFERHCREGKWKNVKKMPIVLAIRKYGAKHFSIHLLEELPDGMSQTDIDKKELEWGMKLGTLSPQGYNLKLGNGHGALSEETKQKIGLGNRGKIVTNETRQRLSVSHKGIRLSPSTKKKLSDYWRGIPLSPLARKRAIESNQKTYTLISPSGVETQITNMAKFCRENGYDKSNMCELVKGRKSSYRGWKVNHKTK